MKIRESSINKKFIPEWNGNSDLPAQEQVVIHFSRIPGSSEKSTYKGFKADSNGNIQLVYNDNLMVAAFVSKIENLETEQGKAVKNGKDLATINSPAINDLFTEIRDYLFPDEEEMPEGEPEA